MNFFTVPNNPFSNTNSKIENWEGCFSNLFYTQLEIGVGPLISKILWFLSH